MTPNNESIEYPRMYRVRQRFENESISDIRSAIRGEFAQVSLTRSVKPGQSVAVTVGSRGIDRLTTLVSTAVECLREMGLRPFIIPAMGSHGRASAEGQAELLHDLGIDESSVGAPVVSSMETVSIGRLDNGAEVHLSKSVLEADHLFVVNRVKPHTAFRAEVESGLCKMMAVGCGKQRGASSMHTYGLAVSIVPAAEMILKKANVLGGLALVENSLDKTHTLRLVAPEDFVDADRELLKLARKMLPRIPIDLLDILVIEEMGKNISGAGIDPNVTGFWRRDGGERNPDYRTLVVLDITPQSHGNAMGIGMADLTTKKLIEKIDLDALNANVFTTGIWGSGRIPASVDNDREAIRMALSKTPAPGRARVVRIKNTLRLESFWASEAILPELTGRSDLIVDERAVDFEFDRDGELLPVFD